MINSYKIPVSPTIISTYNTVGNQGLFDTVNGLFCIQNDLSSVTQEPREERLTHPGFNTTYVTKAIKNPIIVITTKDGREAIKWTLEEIQGEADDLTFPLQDYIHPEKEDRGQGYTVRNVVLKKIEPVGGSVTINYGVDGSILAGLGWRIILEEDVRQFYE